jgi:hypothetical protein
MAQMLRAEPARMFEEVMFFLQPFDHHYDALRSFPITSTELFVQQHSLFCERIPHFLIRVFSIIR